MSLREWAEAYIRHRDLFERRIASMKGVSDGFLVQEHSGGRYPVLVSEELETGLLGKVGERGVIVTLNRRRNVELLVRHWEAFAGQEGLRIVFAAPAQNEKWILVPASHARVAERESLELGLVAMHQSVPEA